MYEARINGSFILKRHPREVIKCDKYTNFNLMLLEQKYMEELKKELDKLIANKSSNTQFISKLLTDKYGESAATIF